MKLKSFVFVLMPMAFLITVFTACEENENERVISTHSKDDSHNTGADCMSCHKKGGSGEGWFTVAGSVFDNANTADFSGAEIVLYTEKNQAGVKVASVQVDELGNFYTTESVDFGEGLYVVLENSGSTKAMNSSITSGACNSCHNSENLKLKIN